MGIKTVSTAAIAMLLKLRLDNSGVRNLCLKISFCQQFNFLYNICLVHIPFGVLVAWGGGAPAIPKQPTFHTKSTLEFLPERLTLHTKSLMSLSQNVTCFIHTKLLPLGLGTPGKPLPALGLGPS